MIVPINWNRAGNRAWPLIRANRDDAVLERLPERLEHRSLELRKLVEEKHSVMRQCAGMSLESSEEGSGLGYSSPKTMKEMSHRHRPELVLRRRVVAERADAQVLEAGVDGECHDHRVGAETFGKAVRPYDVRPGRDACEDSSSRASRTVISIASPRTKVLVLNSPHNPTGGVLSPAALDRVAAAARKHPSTILSDEIYSRLVYDGEARSIASYPGLQDRTIILDGFSKTYAMTGWRLGYGVMETSLAEHVARP